MSHEIETMAYAGTTPWHGLGNPVRRGTPVQEMLVAAGLDWQVERVPLHVADDPTPIEGKYALRRATDRRVFDVVGSRWKPVQNSEILEFFRGWTEAGDAHIETAGSLRGGRQVWALAALGSGFVLPGGDAVRGYVLMVGSHESGRATLLRTTAVRVVCANTLALATASTAKAEVRWSHSRDFRPDDAREQLGIARQQITEFERSAQLLQSLRISRDDAVRILAPVYQPTAEVEDLVGGVEDLSPTMTAVLSATERGVGATPGTAWGLLNGVTYWTDHVAGRSRNSADQALATAWIGNEAARKQQVLDRLLEMAA